MSEKLRPCGHPLGTTRWCPDCELAGRAPQASAPSVQVVPLTDAQIDAILDAPANAAYLVSDTRERMRLFARAVIRAAIAQASAPPAAQQPALDLRPHLRWALNVCKRTDWANGQGYSEAFEALARADARAGFQQPAAQPAAEPGAPAIRSLAAFGAWAAKEFRDSLADVDGGSAQDAMERCGVIVKRTVTEPCGEGCICVEYGEFPHECFVFPAGVSAAIAAMAAPTPQEQKP